MSALVQILIEDYARIFGSDIPDLYVQQVIRLFNKRRWSFLVFVHLGFHIFLFQERGIDVGAAAGGQQQQQQQQQRQSSTPERQPSVPSEASAARSHRSE